MRIRTNRIALIAVLCGAMIAVVEGFSALGCAPRSAAVIAIAGAFGAGAAVTALISQRRSRVAV